MQIKKYDIELDVDFQNLTYTGKERIEVQGDGDRFYLNSAGLQILGIKSGGKNVQFTINEEEETIETDLTLSGDSTVELEFKADVSTTLHGLYVAKYEGGQMITTQFESTGARRAFPCVDHPNYKAVFSLRLIVDSGLEAISNMPVAGEQDIGGGRKAVAFQETPRMSTYLLYIGIGNFDRMERQMGKVKGILVAPKGHLLTTDFPLAETEKIIRYYEEYYGIDYVLPKLHLVSVPEFGSGAMENWGAITFREILLIVNENTSINVKQTIAEVTAHEIAHQWFGDLVTMEWWNDLWLNESFATFMAYKVVDKLHPEWQMFGKMLLSDTAGALTGDALRNSHPIDAEVKSPDDIAQIFDEISYGKGASILRMIEGYVGEDNFRDGIRRYLNEHKYGNARGSDLWSSIEQVSGMPVSRVMEAWVKRSGYPVLKLHKSGSRIRIRQEQFTFNGRKEDKIWPVPLTVVRESGVESVLMDDREIEIEADGFIKLNADETGFYRVLYDSDFMENIRKNSGRLSYLDVWGIVTDMFAFLRSGEISLDQYLESTRHFHSNQDFVVAQEIGAEFLTLNLLMPENSRLKKSAVDFYMGHLNRLGDRKPGEDDNVSVLRGAMAVNCAMLDDGYAEKTGSDYGRFFDVDPDVRQAVAVGYAKWKNSFADLEKTLLECKSDEDRIRIIAALSWLTGKDNFSRLMSLVDSDKIKKQDILRVYVFASMNPDQRERMFSELEKATGTMETYFQGTGYTGMMLESAIPFLGLGRIPEMEALTSRIREASFSKGIDKGMEMLSIYSGLVEKNQ